MGRKWTRPRHPVVCLISADQLYCSLSRIIMTDICQESCTTLEEILESDDEGRFVKLLQDHPNDHQVSNSMVNKCVDFGAKKCLFALIRGQVFGGMRPMLDSHLPDSGVTALAYVAHSCADPQVINLMLSHCGATCLVNVGCTIGVLHGLPIHFVLINLSLMEHLYHWYRGASLIKLIILLCLWETKQILDSARLLAQHTDSINEIAWIILKNGGLKQFTALLLIAREKVIAPFDTGLTIHQYITSEIDSVAKGKLDIEQDEYRCMLRDARRLLAVFEATGDDLSSYCSAIHGYVPVKEVVNDVCDLLLKNKVNVTECDIKLTGYHKEYSGWFELLPKLEEAYDVNNFNPYPADSPMQPDRCCRERLWRKTYIPIPKLACLGSQAFQLSQPRLYSTGACQARKIIPSRRYLAYFTKSLNRFRFA